MYMIRVLFVSVVVLRILDLKRVVEVSVWRLGAIPSLYLFQLKLVLPMEIIPDFSRKLLHYYSNNEYSYMIKIVLKCNFTYPEE